MEGMKNDPHTWRTALEEIRSLGSQDPGATSLAGLHAARQRHNAQFFTPLPLVRLAWRIAQQAFSTVGEHRRIWLLDNSVGSGRFFHYATPDRFGLGGFDLHKDVVEQVQAAAEQAGFKTDLRVSPMEAARPANFHVALANPPFSIRLESPAMEAFACTTWGRYGAGTSAQSDEYAVAQALRAASVVIAVVPASLATAAVDRGNDLFGAAACRLRAVFRLPRSAFQEEGAEVETCMLVFGQDEGEFVGVFSVRDPDAFEVPDLRLALEREPGKAVVRVTGMDSSAPAITMPVTGNTLVRVCHSGRKIHLKFACGLVQAKVLNSVYRERVASTKDHKLPRGVRYSGQGLLDVQNIVATENPCGTLDRLASIVNAAGGSAQVDLGLRRYVAKLARRKALNEAPFGHWVFMDHHDAVIRARALKTVALDPKSWSSPVIKTGEEAELARDGATWRVTKGGTTRVLPQDEAQRLFEMPAASEGWVEVHPPLQRSFPALARDLEAKARKAGLDSFLNWSYQFSDLVEVAMRPRGAVVAWLQGLGKARLSAALPLLLNVRHALVVMPAFLLSEYEKRLVSAGLDPSLWQVITSPDQLSALRRINIISYERLRMPVRPQRWFVEAGEGRERIPVSDGRWVQFDPEGRLTPVDLAEGQTPPPGALKPQRVKDTLTYAKRLRHRIGMTVNDEGEVLSHWQSQQSRAIWQVAAGRCYVTTGTPIPNYPRDMLPIAAYAMGEAVPGQEYGLRQPLLQAANVNSMEFAERGIEAFADRHVVTEWVTQEFSETLSEGAKREVPRINNVEQYRDWTSRFVKRRVHREPEVEACVHIPDPVLRTIDVDWTPEHMAYYLRTADEFAEWYRKTTPQDRMSNFAVLLARIGAVEGACNIPQRTPRKGEVWRGGMTSKQERVVSLACEEASAGHKVVVFATSPRTLEVLERAFGCSGVETVMFHGELDREKRNRELDTRFREGDARVLLASKGCMRSGFDLYVADRVILADRSWSHRIEDQAIRRLLRPQQKNEVIAYRLHLKGAIDVYQDQMVLFKGAAASCGLDYGAPIPADVPFLHLDTMLGRFVEELAQLHGMQMYEFREILKKAA